MKHCRRIMAALLAIVCIALMATAAWAGRRQPQTLHRTSAGHRVPEVSPIPRKVGAVHVNSDSLQEIMRLPDVGEVTAQAVVDERALHGDYQYPEDLLSVRGIGQKTLAGFREMLDLTEGE